MRKLAIMAAGAALASLAACGGGTKAGNNVAVTNDVYVPDDLGNDILLNDSALNGSAANASGNASGNAATTNTSGNRLSYPIFRRRGLPRLKRHPRPRRSAPGAFFWGRLRAGDKRW